MKAPKNKWPEFLFTLAVRLFFGTLFGLGAGFIFWGLGNIALPHATIALINHWGESKAHIVIATWFVHWAIGGAILATSTIPGREMPWYKIDRTYNVPKDWHS